MATQSSRAKSAVPVFNVGDRIHSSIRYPVGHYRVRMYLRGKPGIVEKVLTEDLKITVPVLVIEIGARQ
jgi:hypothetical protein